MEITEEEIVEINNKCPEDQGIFVEPYGIPVDVKEPVVYMRYETGGWRGGSCWDKKAQPYTKDERPSFDVLDILLNKIKPNISYLDYKKIEKLIQTNEDTEREYYGNSTDYKIEYIILSELMNIL
jgi:hypothetical protein